MKKVLAILLTLALVVSLSACGGKSAPAPAAPADNSGPVKIGVISPNTGEVAAYGQAITSGIKLAIKEINAAGGILGGRPIEVVAYMDDKADSTESANAFNKLVSDGVCAIMGSATSGVTAGLGVLADEQGMLLLSPTATADTVTEGHPNVFRTCFRDSYQGEMVAKFAAEKLGVKKVAVLYASGDAYSAGLYDAFVKACPQYKLDLVATESSAATKDTDFNTQLT
ncbi:MAG: ABC transporter substrate-binding protein, partial [Clostridia bacterium]|nr:ABC transporter substrate-binding protein [Clostridia bacterium]